MNKLTQPDYVAEMMSLVREDEAIKAKLVSGEITFEEYREFTPYYISKRDAINKKYGIEE